MTLAGSKVKNWNLAENILTCMFEVCEERQIHALFVKFSIKKASAVLMQLITYFAQGWICLIFFKWASLANQVFPEKTHNPQVGKLVLTRSYTTNKRLILQLKFALLALRLTLDLIMNLGLRSKNGTFVCVT